MKNMKITVAWRSADPVLDAWVRGEKQVGLGVLLRDTWKQCGFLEKWVSHTLRYDHEDTQFNVDGYAWARLWLLL
jgi:hypothetical protein